MLVSVTAPVNFVGDPTSDKIRQELHRLGFVHVTGLETSGINSGYVIGEKLKPSELGSWHINNGITVINTHTGEVWIASATENRNTNMANIALFEKLKLEYKNVFVPCSNGEHLDIFEILSRLTDPNYQIQYQKQN